MNAVNTVEKISHSWKSSMSKQLVEDSFDINVWNKGAYYETGVDQWLLCPYTIVEDYSGYGTGDEMQELNLVLTEEEATQLTLGWGNGDLLGDYIADDDFWLDSNSFVETYKNIPQRVLDWIDNVLKEMVK